MTFAFDPFLPDGPDPIEAGRGLPAIQVRTTRRYRPTRISWSPVTYSRRRSRKPRPVPYTAQ